MAGRSGPVLVTGVAGFIGSHVAEALVARGQAVVGVDNFDPYYERSKKEHNLRGCVEAAKGLGGKGGGFEFVEADICDGAAMKELVRSRRIDGVVHLAARAGVRPSIEDPVGYARANVVGTSVVLEAARSGGCSRVVMASSSSVYGNCRVPAGTAFSEDLDVGEPISPYAATKRACELIGYTHWHLTKMPTACLRFFTVFGPRQRPDLAISLFLTMVSRGEEVPMFGDGTTSRDYTYVADIVSGVLAAYDRIGEHGYRVWNLGGHEPVTLAELIRTVERVVGREVRVDRKPMRAGDVERTYADLSRATKELGFMPRTRLEEGIRRQWAWMQEQGLG